MIKVPQACRADRAVPTTHVHFCLAECTERMYFQVLCFIRNFVFVDQKAAQPIAYDSVVGV